MSKTCKLIAFALAFGLSGTVAWADDDDDCPPDVDDCIEVTGEKKHTAIFIPTAPITSLGVSAAVDTVSAEIADNCRKAMRKLKQHWPLAAAAAVGSAKAVEACGKLPSPKAGHCKTAFVAATAACATVGALVEE